jgi:hypothetical protein
MLLMAARQTTLGHTVFILALRRTEAVLCKISTLVIAATANRGIAHLARYHPTVPVTW